MHYIARVGLDYVKQHILENAERRKELYQRLLFSLEDEADPWHEPEKAQVDTRQFERLLSCSFLHKLGRVGYSFPLSFVWGRSVWGWVSVTHRRRLIAPPNPIPTLALPLKGEGTFKTQLS